MTEEEIIGRLKRIIKIAYSKEFTTFELTYQDVDAIQGLLDLYNKQKEEIERLKNKLENVVKIRKCFIEIYNDKDNEDDI